MQPNTNAVGPGTIQDEQVSPKPVLEGASEYEYVEILNPLSVDFIGVFAVTKPTRAPITISTTQDAPGVTKTENDLKALYGLDLNNRDHQGRVNIQNKVTIKSGKTIRLLGNEAQVVVRQLVNEIMQREGHRLQLADAFQRNLVEQRIILTRGSVAEMLDARPSTIREQLKEAVTKSNQEFPDLKEDYAEEQSPPERVSSNLEPADGFSDPIEQPERPNRGRPAKTPGS